MTLPFPRVDGRRLPEAYRRLLRPGEAVADEAGRQHVLPREFLRIDSWQQALETPLTAHFMAWEFIGVDVRETPLLRGFPRYVPCAILLLATALEVFRLEVGTYVHIAANGGYRSPGHALNRGATRHGWGTAANIYRIGDTYMHEPDAITKYTAVARRMIPGIWVRPYGTAVGTVDDHLHLDLGYTTFEPPNGDDG